MSISMKDAFDVSEVLKHGNPSSLAALASCGFMKRKAKGGHLFFDREEASTIYIVISGLVALYKINSQGEKKVIFVLDRGKMVNEEILQDLPTSINCEVLEDSLILCFKKQDFLSVMEQDFLLTKAVIDSLSMKIRRMYRQLKNTSNSIRGDKRIAAKLWKYSMDHGVPCRHGTRIDMDLSITYLADILGSKRETVSRHLKSLIELKLIIIEEGQFIVPDRDKLSEFFKKS